MTTREDRERAADYARSVFGDDIAAAFAAHREEERERVAKMLDAKAALLALGNTPMEPGAAAPLFRALAAELRSGR